MPVLEKKHVRIIETVVRNDRREVKRTKLWDELVSEYGIGKYKGSVIIFSRNDLESWVKLVITKTGYDPMGDNVIGNRTDTAKKLKDEKWASEKILPNRVICTAIGCSLVSELGRYAIIPEVEFRIDYRKFNPSDYDGVLVVENLEAFIFIHQFRLPEMGRTLVLYRGDDESATAVKRLLGKWNGVKPVYWFPDLDPSGLGIVMDTKEVTHVIVPKIGGLSPDDNVPGRHAKQIVKRPRLKEQARAYGEDFLKLIRLCVNNNLAVSQERMCAKGFELTLVPVIRD